MNPLNQIPSNVRTALYWVGYVLGVLSQATTIVWGAIAAASPDVAMPLWLVIVSAVVAFAQTQLNLLAGSNVTDARTVAVQAPEGASTVTAEVDFNEQGGR
jgi:membrane protein insertase Oxa1/YidC/SpoIIIJ